MPASRVAATGPVAGLVLLSSMLVLFAFFSIGVGAAPIRPGLVLDALLGRGDATTRTIVLDLRLPRTLLAILVGGGLGLGGVVFQALLRNPLAEPYILGVSGGAAVGAVSVFVLGLGSVAAFALPVAAFAGALLAIAAVFRIATAVGGALDTRVMVLAGVVVGAFFNAVILLLLTVAEAESFRSAVFWIMGNLAGASWGGVALLAAYLIPSAAVLLALARPLNLISMGDETAFHLGTRVETVKRVAYGVTSLLVAASVAVSGVIGFIGLIIPHALRLIWGSGHRFLLPASMLAGGAFLLAADTVARTIAAPVELPVGVVTALVGVPIFVTLLIRGHA